MVLTHHNGGSMIFIYQFLLQNSKFLDNVEIGVICDNENVLLLLFR